MNDHLPPPEGAGPPDVRLLGIGGEIGELLRTTDWSGTPLGPVEDWPETLRTALGILLRSRFPMFVFWGPELIQLYNEAYIPIPGEKHPRSLGAPARETWAEIWDVLGPLVESVVDRGEPTWSEDQLLVMERHGFEEETYFTFSYSPLVDSDGVVGVFCACTETTERVLAERRIRVARELAEQTRGAASPTSAAERAAEVLAGVPADVPAATIYLVGDDARTATLAAAVGVESGSAAAPWTVDLDGGEGPAPIAHAVASGTVTTIDLEAVADGLPNEPWGEPPCQGWIGPLSDPATGRVSAVLAVGLSPRRPLDDGYRAFLGLIADNLAKALADARARQREQERLDALSDLNRAKTEFFSNVSHEFRTPLTLILGHLDQARRGGELAPEALDQVQRSAQRLLKLVSSVLDVAQVEAGRLRPAMGPTDLSALTAELAGVFRSAMELGGLRYEVDIEPLPQPVHVDVQMWERIVLNLLSNALKFTREGEVRLCLRASDDAAVLEVSDTGPGVAHEHVPHLFDRFYRVPERGGRTHEGAGIGLSLVRELVELHRGEVAVASTPGEGSTFTVVLPFGTGHLPADQLVQGSEPTSGGLREAYLAEAIGWVAADRDLPAEDRAGRAEVLVVDDNADVRRYVQQVLSVHWNVRTAEDGEVALELLRSHRSDLVLADVMMPRLDGNELLAAIRADDQLQDVPVVLLSARAGDGSISEGLGAGADDYLVKPFTAAELVARVRSNLELSRMRSTVSASRAREQMITGLSHDMQTPLAFLLGAMSELGAGDLPTDDRDLLLRQATARGAQLRRLVSQFLDEARVGLGAPLVGSTEPVDVGRIVTSVVDTLDHRDRVAVEVATDRLALADADRVEQIVTNLVENALRYSSDEVRVRVEDVGDGVAVTVDDTGPGVHRDERGRIFDRYYRGSAAEGTRGTGLGLYVSRALAEAQGGRIEVADTDDGHGARFRLVLGSLTDAGSP